MKESKDLMDTTHTMSIHSFILWYESERGSKVNEGCGGGNNRPTNKEEKKNKIGIQSPIFRFHFTHTFFCHHHHCQKKSNR